MLMDCRPGITAVWKRPTAHAGQEKGQGWELHPYQQVPPRS